MIPPLYPLVPGVVAPPQAGKRRWVARGVGLLAAGLALAWCLYRTRGGRRSTSPMTTGQAQAAAKAVRFLLSHRRSGASLDCRQMLQFLPAALGLLRELEQAQSAPALSLPGPGGVVEDGRWVRAIHALDRDAAEPRAHTERLIHLAEWVAPVSEETRRTIWQEVWCGGMAALSASRDEALGRIRAFCELNDLPLPQGILQAVGHARILAHDAQHLPSVMLLTAGVLWRRSSLLVYRPERVAGMGARPVGPNALPAFASLTARAGEALVRQSPATGAYTAHKARAVMRAVWRAVLAPLFERRADDMLAQLRACMAPVWGERPDLARLRRELLHAAARFLGDLVWGEHVPITYTDRFGIAQCLSCALARQPDQRAVLRAWLGGGRGSVEHFGRLLLAEAAEIARRTSRVDGSIDETSHNQDGNGQRGRGRRSIQGAVASNGP